MARLSAGQTARLRTILLDLERALGESTIETLPADEVADLDLATTQLASFIVSEGYIKGRK